MALTETFLELAPEFGGTRFGPFKGMEIRLGSDPGSNDITLPENLGVLPNHMKLIAQGDGSFIVAPIERTAGVFVYRSGASAKQVTSPIAIQGASDAYAADSFSVVTPEGPRFYVLLVMQKEQGKSKESQFDKARGRLSGKSLWSELKRQGLVMFLTTKGGQQFQRWGTFVKTGAIFRPRYLIGGIAMLAGWLFAGGLGLVACQAAVSGKKAGDELNTCKDTLAATGASGGKPSLDIFVAKVLGPPGSRDEEWVRSLSTDQDFMVALRQELNALYNNPTKMDKLRWVYRTPGSDFVAVKREMEKAAWPAPLVRVMAYTAAIEGAQNREKEWTWIETDSLGAEACGRGPMAITWRQGHNLRLPNVALDAVMTYSNYGVAGDPEKLEAIKATAGTARTFTVPPDDQIGNIDGLQADNTQDIVCLFQTEPGAEPTDPRSSKNVPDLIKALNTSIGPKGSKLPSADTGLFGIESRLLKYWAADYKGEFDKLDFSTGIPTAILNDAKPVKAYAIQKAAETVAKAVAIPCLAITDPNLKNYDTDKTIGPLPEPLDCIIVEGIIRYNVQ